MLQQGEVGGEGGGKEGEREGERRRRGEGGQRGEERKGVMEEGIVVERLRKYPEKLHPTAYHVEHHVNKVPYHIMLTRPISLSSP